MALRHDTDTVTDSDPDTGDGHGATVRSDGVGGRGRGTGANRVTNDCENAMRSGFDLATPTPLLLRHQLRATGTGTGAESSFRTGVKTRNRIKFSRWFTPNGILGLDCR